MTRGFFIHTKQTVNVLVCCVLFFEPTSMWEQDDGAYNLLLKVNPAGIFVLLLFLGETSLCKPRP